jgi:hypothetical protein
MNSLDWPKTDPLETTLKRRVKHWAAFQSPPRELRQRLLAQAAQADGALAESETQLLRTRAGLLERRPSQDVFVSYLMFSLQASNVRMMI